MATNRELLRMDKLMLQLPTDRQRSATQVYSESQEPVQLSPELVEAVKRLSKQEETTIFVTLLASFKALLYRYTEQEAIVVGTKMPDRTRVGIEIPGSSFVSTIAIKTECLGSI